MASQSGGAAKLLCGFCLGWRAVLAAVEAPAVADGPVFASGDCWTYANSEWPNPAGKALRLREWISRITPEGEIEITSGPKDRVVRIRLDRDGNYIRKYAWSFEPSESDLRFPLAVGNNWHASYVVHPSDSAPSSQQETDFKVVAYGPVHVQAGDFEAFEVHAIGAVRLSSLESPWPGTTFRTIWYAPAVRRIVKREVEFRDARTRFGFRQELISFGHLEPASELVPPHAAAAESEDSAASRAADEAAASSGASKSPHPGSVGHC